MYKTSIELDFDALKQITIRKSSDKSIEINFDASKQITIRQASNLSDRPDFEKLESAQNSQDFFWRGTILPHGTELRAEYGNKMHYAKINNGAITYNGKPFRSPSPAARAVTGKIHNGWLFWQIKLPNTSDWVLLDSLRNAQ